jgi:hypothetical protein
VRAQLHAGRVGPVYVLGHQQHRSPGRGPLHQPEHRVEQPQPFQLRRGHRGRRFIPAQPGGQIRGQPTEFRGPVRVLGRRRDGPGQLRRQFLPHGQRRLAADIHAGAHRDPGSGVVGAAGQLGHQARLADPGFPGDQHHAPVPGTRRRPGRRQRAQFRGPPEQRPGCHRSGRQRGAPRASGLGQRRSQRRARPYAQVRTQPVGHLPPGHQGAGPVAGRGQLPDQVGVGRLVQRIELAAQPRPARRADRVAVTLGRRGSGRQRPSQLRAQPPPGGFGPVVGVSGEQLAVAQRGRGGGVSGGGAALAVGQVDRDGLGSQPDRGPRGDQRVVTDRLAQRPDRSTQVRPPGWPGGAGPQRGRHGLTVLRSRAQGEDGEQPTRRWRERQLLAVAFRGYSAEQPHLQHAPTVNVTWAFVPR